MAMRTVDPDIELVAVGSSSRTMPTFGEWEQTVLELSYHAVDYVSLHAYYQEHDGDAASFLASAVDMDLFIDQVVATADAVRAKGKHTKKINLSFDEWNVWYQSKPHHGPGVEPWDVAPRVIEDEYSITDAVVVGTLLNSLLRHADRVHIGAQAQLVNVIGLLRSEPGGEAWKQTIAHPFEQVRRLATGNVLQVVTTSEKYETAKFDAVDVVDASATYDEEFLTVFLANRDQEQPASVEVPCGRSTSTASPPPRCSPRPGVRTATRRTSRATTRPSACAPSRTSPSPTGSRRWSCRRCPGPSCSSARADAQGFASRRRTSSASSTDSPSRAPRPTCRGGSAGSRWTPRNRARTLGATSST